MKRRWFEISLLWVTLLLIALIVTDAFPWLRGPAPDSPVWYWAYFPHPLGRLWFPLVAAVLLGSGILVWLKFPRLPTWLGLIWLMIGMIALQCGLIYLDQGEVSAELINRTLADNTNGYFRISADVTDWNQLLRHFPQEMGNFASEHARTHPPGLLLLNQLLLLIARKWPLVAQKLAVPVFRARCTDLWIHAQTPATAGALLLASFFPLFAAAIGLLPIYLWAKRIATPWAGRIAVSGVAVLPALMLFAPFPDQVYLLLSGMVGWLFTVGLQTSGRKQIVAYFGAGVVLSTASFFSLGNGAFALFLFIYTVAMTKSWRSCLFAWAIFGMGSLLVWGLDWGIFGVPPWAIIRSGLSQHYELVTHKRSHLIWSFFNLVDLVVFAGVPLWLLFGAMMRNRPNRIAVSFLLFLLMLDLSGTARGEVGRLWLFLMPLIPLALATDQSGIVTARTMQLVCVAQLCLILALGWAWQPVQAVIMRPTRPIVVSDPPTHLVSQRFGDEIELIGYDWLRRTPSQLYLKLFWQADRPTFYPYTVFRHLVSADGALISQKDSWAIDGQWPTSCWDAGELIIDEAILDDVATKSDRFEIGLYDLRDNTRLPLADGATSYTISLTNP